MKKFSEFFTESILEKEKTKQEVDSIINEGIVDGFKKLASAGKEKLSKFKDTFADKAKELLSKTLGTLVKSLVSSIQSKDKKPADIKSQLESNPLFKDFLSETNAIEEIQSDFSKEDVEDVVKKEDNVTKESIEEYYKQNNIITEDFGDMADTITTKIFSSVYKIIAGALGAIGWVIKPSFRNWFDKLVRKVQKAFYHSKLGQSIKDLPPEVEQSVMEKFQAIIGIVVVVVMVWIIISHIKGEGDSISSDDTDGKSFSGKGAAADDTTDNVDTTASDNANTADNSSNTDAAADVSNNGEEIGDATTSNARNGWHIMKKGKYPVSSGSAGQQESDYIKQRVEEIAQRRGGKLDDFWRRRYTRMAQKEWDAAESNGKILSIKNHKILAHDMDATDKKEIYGIYKGNDAVKNATTNTANTAQSEADKLDALHNSTSGESASSMKMFIAPAAKTDSNVELPAEAHNLQDSYVDARLKAIPGYDKMSEIQQEKLKDMAEMEFNKSFDNGNVLVVKNNNIFPINAEQYNNPQEYLKISGILNGNNADFTKIDSDISRFNLNQIIESGAKSITMQSGETPIKINIENLPDADKKLNPSELLDKYLSSYL